MARGTAPFDGEALRTLRLTTSVDGRRLSAEALARLVGTSKARILAYEQGHSVPEPSRIKQLAGVFQVPSAVLTPAEYTHPSLRELRVQAGLTIAKTASLLGMSRKTFGHLENHARQPRHDDGTLQVRLAYLLGVSPSVIRQALYGHPQAERRRARLADYLLGLFKEIDRGRIAVVDPDDPSLLSTADLLHRPASVAARLVNHEISGYRQLMKERDLAKVELEYAPSGRSAHVRDRVVRKYEERIALAAVHSAQTLCGFLMEAMPARQWRMLVAVANAGAGGLPVKRQLEPSETVETLASLAFLAHVEMTQRAEPQAVTYHLTPRGMRVVRKQWRLYECLYPSVRTPTFYRYDPDLPNSRAGNTLALFTAPDRFPPSEQ
ncbi:helix-turn-helix domain-containing protein [Streptomyces alkaliterrae]|uniref:Helix-turn-helix domain-containing protein n=1 Tax=Streptomyces alkaliterrae TaxID=2213162 RepID=A0A7W3WTU1_9ACTN|nr:helix-turn-helix transcriptional regulator [Streptomyces alkaliterrae]MBB1258408.1 helix-turn-helix domain-containing protein [Streptomyces alkaliterrae]